MKPSPQLDEFDVSAMALAESISWAYWYMAVSSPRHRNYIARLYAEWARQRLRTHARAVIEGHRN